MLRICICWNAPGFLSIDENKFSVQFKSPWPFDNWCIMAHMVSTEENCKWLPGVCSLQELISTSLQLMGSNEQLSSDWGVEHDSSTALTWELTWKCPLVISKALRNQNEVPRVRWVQKRYILKAKRTEHWRESESLRCEKTTKII